MEATLIAIRPNRCVIPLTVGVGHTSALVSAGLAATLARMPGCEVRQWDTTPGACARNCATPANLVFGDSALLKHCQENSKRISQNDGRDTLRADPVRLDRVVRRRTPSCRCRCRSAARA